MENKLINFTEENLSKIHVSQFKQFLDKYGIEYGCRNEYIWLSNNYEFGFVDFRFFPKGDFIWQYCNNQSMNAFDVLLTKRYPNYERGNMTQFHQLFTEVYNEIISYEVKDE